VSALDFVHVYRPATDSSTRTLLLLHGTGGNEQDLLPLAAMLDPSAGVLSPRGKVLENGAPRFFRRLAEGVFDLEDLRRRAGELAEFVTRAIDEYGIRSHQLVAVGFSNGANIASAVLLLHPDVLGAAILLRGMVPIVPDATPALPQTPVLLSNGRQDPLVSIAETERLVALLKTSGADVTLAWQPAGHQLTAGDIEQAKTWLSAVRV
jgi:predicted esterase